MSKSHFFPLRGRRTACVHAAHKTQSVCEWESAIRGMFGQRFQDLRVSVCMRAPCRKFLTCFLTEPHLPRAQTHIWTHRLEKISKPATHRGCGRQRAFQIDHKSNAQRVLRLSRYASSYRRQKGSFCSVSCHFAWWLEIRLRKRRFPFE